MMNTEMKKTIEEAPEKILEAQQMSRVAAMAVDFLDQDNSRESIEAIQYLLRKQDELLGELFETIGAPAFPEK